jgi:hypothetical protein
MARRFPRNERNYDFAQVVLAVAFHPLPVFISVRSVYRPGLSVNVSRMRVDAPEAALTYEPVHVAFLPVCVVDSVL